jgi:hypothetical protein
MNKWIGLGNGIKHGARRLDAFAHHRRFIVGNYGIVGRSSRQVQSMHARICEP